MQRGKKLRMNCAVDVWCDRRFVRDAAYSVAHYKHIITRDILQSIASM